MMINKKDIRFGRSCIAEGCILAEVRSALDTYYRSLEFNGVGIDKAGLEYYLAVEKFVETTGKNVPSWANDSYVFASNMAKDKRLI
jgi:hypothetical protein